MSKVAAKPRHPVKWWLAAIGIALIVATGVLRGHQFDSGTTTEKKDGKTITKVTEKEAPPSDALLLGLLGLGGLFVLCGAFAGRISKVTLPGGSVIEFAEAQKQAAAAVERVVERGGGQDAPDPPSQVAATTIAAARGFEIWRLASAEPAAVTSLATAAKLPLDVKALSENRQLTREMWDSLAEAALAEVARAPSDVEES
jgi:hypothetical protein